MLDKEIIEPAKQQIKLKIKQRAEKLNDDHQKNLADLSRRGLLLSGYSLSAAAGLAKDYVIDQAQIAWEVLHRFVTTGGVDYYDELANELKETVASYLARKPEDIPSIKISQIITPRDDKLLQIYARGILEGHDQALTFINSEIDLFVHTLKKESEGHNKASQAYAVTTIQLPLSTGQLEQFNMEITPPLM